MPPVPTTGSRWRSSDRLAHGVNLPRHNQHGTADLKSLYLGLLLRALTGGLDAPGQPEPLVNSEGQRKNIVGKFNQTKQPLIWDGYQRGIEAGRILERVLDANVPGAIAEVGVFRGGLAAYLQGVLLARQQQKPSSSTQLAQDALRQMWLIDSFEGLPDADGMSSRNAAKKVFNSAGAAQARWARDLSVGEDTVYATFERFRLLERGNVHALRGFVNETLPRWPQSRRLALLRIDVDIYSATYDTLHYLYPRLSVGGAVLFDDWKYSFSREAIVDYRTKHGINEPIRFVRGTVDPQAYWFKCRPATRKQLDSVPETCRPNETADQYEHREKDNLKRLFNGDGEVLPPPV